MAETDLSRVINLIMENPKILEEIKGLLQKNESGESENQENAAQEVLSKEEKNEPLATQASFDIAPQRKDSRRTELLRALQPYLSKERGKAIESMIMVADILTVVREN